MPSILPPVNSSKAADPDLTLFTVSAPRMAADPKATSDFKLALERESGHRSERNRASAQSESQRQKPEHSDNVQRSHEPPDSSADRARSDHPGKDQSPSDRTSNASRHNKPAASESQDPASPANGVAEKTGTADTDETAQTAVDLNTEDTVTSDESDLIVFPLSATAPAAVEPADNAITSTGVAAGNQRESVSAAAEVLNRFTRAGATSQSGTADTVTGLSTESDTDGVPAATRHFLATASAAASSQDGMLLKTADLQLQPTRMAVALPISGAGENSLVQAEKLFSGELKTSLRTEGANGVYSHAGVLAQSQPGAVDSAARMQMPVSISFGKPQWAGMVAERAAMMAAQNIQSADLQLDPPELGPLQVRVHVHQDQVSVSFVAANAVVRDALDQTAMRLRELCDQQGLNLVDVDVSADQGQQQPSDQASESAGRTLARGDDTDENPLADTGAAIQQMVVTSGIDHYA